MGSSRSPPRERSRSKSPEQRRERSRSPEQRRERSRSRSRGGGGGGGGGGGWKAGIACRWNEKGFCFIKPNEGGDDIFAHVSAIKDGNCVREGAEVEYKSEYDSSKGKNRAIEVLGGFTQDEKSRDRYDDRGGGGGGYDRGGGNDRGGYDRRDDRDRYDDRRRDDRHDDRRRDERRY